MALPPQKVTKNYAFRFDGDLTMQFGHQGAEPEFVEFCNMAEGQYLLFNDDGVRYKLTLKEIHHATEMDPTAPGPNSTSGNFMLEPLNPPSEATTIIIKG